MGNGQQREDPERAKRVRTRPIEALDEAGTLLLLALETSEEVGAALKPIFTELGIAGEGLFEIPAAMFHQALASRNISPKTFDAALVRLKARYDEQQSAVRSVAETPPDFPPWTLPAANDLIATLLFYHDASRNLATSGARATRRDWATQPRTVTRWWGAPCISLPVSLPSVDLRNVSHYDVINRASSVNTPLNLHGISTLLFHSLAVTAAKDEMSRVVQPRSAWTKRVNASSGGLHPVELHLIGTLQEKPVVAHYSVTTHALEMRAELPSVAWSSISSALPPSSLLATVNLRLWREVWKYGERGLRYSLLDAGHGLGSLIYAAALIGWTSTALIGPSENTIATLTGLTRARFEEEEEEIPAVLVLLQTGPAPHTPNSSVTIDAALVQSLSGNAVSWRGVPSTLSWRRLNWPVVSAAERASRSTQDSPAVMGAAVPVALSTAWQKNAPLVETRTAAEVARTRRSATVYMPGSMAIGQLIGLLSIVLRDGNRLLSSWPGDYVDMIGVYVINVEGLASGFYVLLRSGTLQDAQRACSAATDLSWTHPANILNSIPLYLLSAATKEQTAEAASAASCKQKVVETSCVTFSFLAPLPALLQARSAHAYRCVHFEAGMLGQWLYMQASAVGLGATGIGCFVDDVALGHFGLPPAATHRCVYHFAVGIPSPDTRYTQFHYEKSMMMA